MHKFSSHCDKIQFIWFEISLSLKCDAYVHVVRQTLYNMIWAPILAGY